MSLEMTNNIYRQIFNKLKQKCNEIKEDFGIDISDKLPPIYLYYDKSIQNIPIVDKYELELENNIRMTFFIDQKANVFDTNGIIIGEYSYIDNLIKLS